MLRLTALACLLLACTTNAAEAPSVQRMLSNPSFPRLTETVLQVTAPATRVSGEPGAMRYVQRGCAAPVAGGELRQRIVDVAAQEWGWFGFNVDDLHGQTPPPRTRSNANNNRPRIFLPLDASEVAQVAPTIGGYWSAIPGSDWIWGRQNEAWQQDGLAGRWRDPWSAAFISWVLCESGVSEQRQFERAIAHHTYIDQAIKARDRKDSAALYWAYEPGEQVVNPGDLLCSGLRPVYETLAERRAQLGVGARTHCDIVVEVNDSKQQILTIGGNVRSSVRMKVFPASSEARAALAPLPTSRYIFAHLKLQTPTAASDALRLSPTLQHVSCQQPPLPNSLTTASISLSAAPSC